MDTSNLVSVIIPTYNRKDYVQIAINSVLSQTYPQLEVIVVDDGSTDGTFEELKTLYGDQICVHCQENRGESAARNAGIMRSQGEFIAFLDSDDLWLPAKIQRQLDFFRSHPDHGLVSCQVYNIDGSGKVLGKDPLSTNIVDDTLTLETLVLRSPVYPSTLVVRRKCIDQAHLYNESIRYGEDRDFILRLAAQNRVGFIREPLACLRSHPDKQSRLLLPRTELERRANERMQMLENAFELFQKAPLTAEDPNRLAELKARALAREVVYKSVGEYLYENESEGASLLSQAISLDSKRWGDGREISDLIFRYAVDIACDVSTTDRGRSMEEAVQFIHRFYENLPLELKQSGKREHQKMLASLYINQAFYEYKAGRNSQIPAYIFRAFTLDRSWLFNRGAWSIGIRSFAKSISHRA